MLAGLQCDGIMQVGTEVHACAMLGGVFGQRVPAFVDEPDGECISGLGAHGCKGRIGSVALAWCSSFALNRSTPQVVIEQDSDGNFAYVPELKGCRTQGDRTEEAMK